MTARIVFGILLGAAVGMAVGYASRQAGGTCPLMCNPYGGAIYGALVGALIAGILGGRVRSFTPSPHLVRIGSAQDFQQQVLGREGRVLVEFYTNRCPACSQLEPEIHDLADRFAGRATVALVDAQKLPDLAQRHGVDAVPALVLFLDGKEVERALGYRSADKLAAMLERVPAATAP